jgi:hypothetical protein
LGANKLNEVVKKQEQGVLSSLASAIGEPGQKALIDQGTSVLTSLLGGKTASALTDAVGQYAGITNLLGLLGPVVLGVIEGRRVSEGSMPQASRIFLPLRRVTSALQYPPATRSILAELGFLMMWWFREPELHRELKPAHLVRYGLGC